ncbi:MAG: hypothetical protein PUK63_02020 [Clostridiales bacterium]|jgi:hypothetical protein|nr:hypothetical protein [Clostridiales bacterium]MDY3061141.1 hypothetical protein [Eubacteriales bacterium]
MIFTVEQMRHLAALGLIDDGKYKFKITRTDLTESERDEIIKIDTDWFELNGEHLISNIDAVS